VLAELVYRVATRAGDAEIARLAEDVVEEYELAFIAEAPAEAGASFGESGLDQAPLYLRANWARSSR
jgi:hypothetical protein